MRSFSEPGRRAGLGDADRGLLHRQGLRALAAGRLDEADDLFRVLAALFPLAPEAQRGLAEVADRRGRPVRAHGHRAVAARLEEVARAG